MAANRAFAGLLAQYLLVVICGFEHKLCSNYVQVNCLSVDVFSDMTLRHYLVWEVYDPKLGLAPIHILEFLLIKPMSMKVNLISVQ